MRIVEFFKDWLSDHEEKKKFREAWINEKLSNFGWDDEVDSYNADLAYEMYKLTKRVDELEQKMK